MLAIAGLRWAGCLPKTPNRLLVRWLWPIASPSHLEQVARELWPELWLADPGPPTVVASILQRPHRGQRQSRQLGPEQWFGGYGCTVGWRKTVAKAMRLANRRCLGCVATGAVGFGVCFGAGAGCMLRTPRVCQGW